MEKLFEVSELVCNNIEGAVAYMEKVYGAYSNEMHKQILINEVQRMVNGKDYKVFGGGFETVSFAIVIDGKIYAVMEPACYVVVIEEVNLRELL